MNNIKEYFTEVVTGNLYSLKDAAKHNCAMIEAKVKAKDMPSIEANFVAKNHFGCCLHYGMTLFKLLREHEINCYIAVTKEENPQTHKKTDNHVSVCYFKDGKRFIADPVEAVKTAKVDFFEIPIEEFAAQQGMICLYDPYGEYGEELFFGQFLNHPIEILKVD